MTPEEPQMEPGTAITLLRAVWKPAAWLWHKALQPLFARLGSVRRSGLREYSEKWADAWLAEALQREPRTYRFFGALPLPNSEEVKKCCENCDSSKVLLLDAEDEAFVQTCAAVSWGVPQGDHTDLLVKQCRVKLDDFVKSLPDPVEVRYHRHLLPYSCHLFDQRAYVALYSGEPSADNIRHAVLIEADPKRNRGLFRFCEDEFERLWKVAVPARVTAEQLPGYMKAQPDPAVRSQILRHWQGDGSPNSLDPLTDFLSGDECLSNESDGVRAAALDLLSRHANRFSCRGADLAQGLTARLRHEPLPSLQTKCAETFLRFAGFVDSNVTANVLLLANRKGLDMVLRDQLCSRLLENPNRESVMTAVRLLPKPSKELQELVIEKLLSCELTVLKWDTAGTTKVWEALEKMVTSGRLDDDIVPKAIDFLAKLKPYRTRTHFRTPEYSSRLLEELKEFYPDKQASKKAELIGSAANATLASIDH